MNFFTRIGRPMILALCMLAPALVVTKAVADALDTMSGDEQEVQQVDAEEYTALMDMFGVSQIVTYQKIGEDAVIGGDTIIGSHAEIQLLSARNLIGILLKSDDTAVNDFDVPKEALQEALGELGPEGAIPPSVNIWPSRRIPYRIDSSITDPELISNIRAATEIWNSYKIVTFVPAVATDRAVLTILDGPGDGWHCQATLGYKSKVGGWIKLNPPCTLGAVVHELAHSLGLMHEHQRPDRDRYISVQSFVKDNPNYAIGPVSGWVTDYDLCSIVHYSERQTPQTMMSWFTLTDEGKKQLANCSAALPKECRKVGQRCQPSKADLDLLSRAYATSE